MNFELKSIGLEVAATEKCDALIVLVSQDFKAGKDDLSALLAQTLKSGDLETKAGKSLSLYRPVQASATRVVLVGVGAGSARDVRGALMAAVASVKSSALKKLVVCFAAPAREEAVRAG